MVEADPPDTPAADAAFLQQLAADRAAGLSESATHYLARFPGAERAVGAAFQLENTVKDPSVHPESEADPEALRELGQYEIQAVLGRGGQGVVYRARDRELDRVVALKVLRGTPSADSLARLRREASVASRLDHPNLCGVHEFGHSEGLRYIAMPFLSGATLSQILANPSTAGQTSASSSRSEFVTRWVRLFEALARGLSRAHEAGIVHRDIKPANLLLTDADRLVLLDFGLARDTESEEVTLTQSFAILGTPMYMSPEQVMGKVSDIGPLTDVWSLGVCLYETVTGLHPFRAPTRQQVFESILRNEPPDARTRNTAISRDLAAVLRTAIEKRPENRYRSAEALADDLAAIAAGQAVSVKPLSILEKSWRWAKQRPAIATLLAMTLLLTGATGWVAAKWSDIQRGEQSRLRERIEGWLEAGFQRLGEESLHGEWDGPGVSTFFRQVLEADPGNIEGRAGLAWALVSEEKADQALRVLNEAPATSPSLDIVRISVLQSLGRAEEAMNLSNRMPKPANALDHFLWGQRFLMAGERGETSAFSLAVKQFRLAVSRAERIRAIHHFQLAHAASHADDHATAREAASFLTHRWPSSASAHFWAGFALVDVDSDACLASYERARELGFPEAQLDFNKAMVLERLGRLPEALALLQRRAAASPSADSYTKQGEILKDLGQFAEAKRILGEAIRLNPNDGDAHMALGNTWLAEGFPAEAVACLRTAARLSPKSSLVHFNLGNALDANETPEEAAEAYARAAGLPPHSGEGIWNNWSRVVARTNPERALEIVAEGQRHYPNSWSLAYNQGNVLSDLGRFEEAARAFEEATRLNPQSGEAWCNLGHILVRQKQPGAAVAAFRRGHEIGSHLDGWPYPSAQWLDRAQRAAASLERLEAFASDPGNAELNEVQQALDAARQIGSAHLAVPLWRRLFELETEPSCEGLLQAAVDAAAAAGAPGGVPHPSQPGERGRDWFQRGIALLPDPHSPEAARLSGIDRRNLLEALVFPGPSDPQARAALSDAWARWTGWLARHQ